MFGLDAQSEKTVQGVPLQRRDCRKDTPLGIINSTGRIYSSDGDRNCQAKLQLCDMLKHFRVIFLLFPVDTLPVMYFVVKAGCKLFQNGFSFDTASVPGR